MRVSKLELTGVGPFEGAVFEIPEPTKGTGELVLFEGPNGSGKTTIADTIAHLGSGSGDLGKLLRPNGCAAVTFERAEGSG